FALLPVAGFLLRGERMAARAFLADLAAHSFGREHLLAGGAAVGAVGPVGAVALGHQPLELLAVVFAGRGDAEVFDEFAAGVALHVILVAVVAHVVFLRPARVGVFLRELVGLLPPWRRHFSGFDLRVLFAAVALLGHFHKGG